jgi:DNA modification methylase
MQTTVPNTLHRAEHLTFKGNRRDTRYGWLRLTPAYSVHLVADLIEKHANGATVLDPFCGTGTTALVCAERGIACDTTDINPFLVWLATAKTRDYSTTNITAFLTHARRVAEVLCDHLSAPPWLPPLHQVEKWWDEPTLAALGRACCAIRQIEQHVGTAVADLLKVAFCRLVIENAHVSFGHQSMSFRDRSAELGLFVVSDGGHETQLADHWLRICRVFAESAHTTILTPPRVVLGDARHLTKVLPSNHYGCVITSPPYPNRMSYIRELRPYMYWLGYLNDGRQAGELDWQAIGGTWGCATSNLNKWTQPPDDPIPHDQFNSILGRIARRSPLLSRYVQKYFHDALVHCRELLPVVQPGGSIHYIVGNSKFYDVLLPVEELYAALFAATGFAEVSIEAIRKRTSKKELFEFLVSARKPSIVRETSRSSLTVTTPKHRRKIVYHLPAKKHCRKSSAAKAKSSR